MKPKYAHELLNQRYGVLADKFMNKFNYSITDKMIKLRVLIAIDYYLSNGFPAEEQDLLLSQLNGIDFNHDVSVIQLEEGTVLDQLQDSGFAMGEIRQGNYYSFHNVQEHDHASHRGIADVTFKEVELPLEELTGTDSDLDSSRSSTHSMVYAQPKQCTKFVVTKPLRALMSIAKPVSDNWSVKFDGGCVEVSTTGGGLQLYIGMNINNLIKSEHEKLYLNAISKLTHNPEDLDEADRAVLIKELMIIKQRVPFLKSKGNDELVRFYDERLKKLIQLISSKYNRRQLVEDSDKFDAGTSIMSIKWLAHKVYSEVLLSSQALEPSITATRAAKAA